MKTKVFFDEEKLIDFKIESLKNKGYSIKKIKLFLKKIFLMKILLIKNQNS